MGFCWIWKESAENHELEVKENKGYKWKRKERIGGKWKKKERKKEKKKGEALMASSSS